jgi:hypothetical protein
VAENPPTKATVSIFEGFAFEPFPGTDDSCALGYCNAQFSSGAAGAIILRLGGTVLSGWRGKNAKTARLFVQRLFGKL